MRPSGNSRATGAKVPAGHYLYAVDLSHYNSGNIVWDSLRVMTDSRRRTVKSISKAENIVPVSYVILKASEGIKMKDNKFSKNWNDAYNAGMRRGAYHFYRTSKDPLEQAQNYICATGKLKDSDLPPILDIETTHSGYSKKTLNDNVLKWLKTVGEHYGRTPIVYTSESFAEDILSPQITGHYPLWIARYRERTPDRENWKIWQFTDRAVVYGIDGFVDLNVLRPDFFD